MISNMGGTALGEQLSRLSRERYFEIVTALKIKLLDFFDVVEIPTCLETKSSFGDVDFIVSGHRKVLDVVNDLGSKKAVRNGNVSSFEYEGHQIDLISTDKERLALTRFYYSFGDMGMIIGMMCRVIGLKFGFKGLSLMHETRRIKLSDDLSKILDFLCFDKTYVKKNFKKETDIFEFITSSKYFRASMFRRDRNAHDPLTKKANFNSDTKNRLEKRDMFRRFVEFCESLKDADRVDLAVVRQEALTFFNKQRDFDDLVREEANRVIIKQKFNGTVVSDITGLCNAELGRFMTLFKKYIPPETMLNMDAHEIQQQIKSYMTSLQGTH